MAFSTDGARFGGNQACLYCLAVDGMTLASRTLSRNAASCDRPPLLLVADPFALKEQVFEQDAHAFTRRLHGILTPGPLCYVAKMDAFVLGNSELGVDCYKYQARLPC